MQEGGLEVLPLHNQRKQTRGARSLGDARDKLEVPPLHNHLAALHQKHGEVRGERRSGKLAHH